MSTIAHATETLAVLRLCSDMVLLIGSVPVVVVYLNAWISEDAIDGRLPTLPRQLAMHQTTREPSIRVVACAQASENLCKST
jgi:precorrin-4 methylase